MQTAPKGPAKIPLCQITCKHLLSINQPVPVEAERKKQKPALERPRSAGKIKI